MHNLDLYTKNIELSVENNNLSLLKNKSIVIIGANGLIGSGIVDVLNYLNINKKYNIHIVATVRNKNKILKRFSDYQNIEIIEYDINNQFTYTKKVDYIINAASPADPKRFSNDPSGTLITNFIGTKNILEYLVNNKDTRLLYISSGEIYGQGDENIDKFKEDYVGSLNSMNFRSCYPIGKLAAENLCITYLNQYSLDVVIARLCHTYGPTQTSSDSRVISQFINNILNKEDIIMKSDGKQIRSYCYVIDSVTGILNILTKGKVGEVYNVANNNSIISIRDLANLICKIGNKKLIINIPTEQEKKSYNPVTRSVLDGSKLEQLGWKCVFNIQDGIENTIDIMK